MTLSSPKVQTQKHSEHVVDRVVPMNLPETPEALSKQLGLKEEFLEVDIIKEALAALIENSPYVKGFEPFPAPLPRPKHRRGSYLCGVCGERKVSSQTLTSRLHSSD